MRSVRNRILALISSFVILFSIIAVPTKVSNVEAKIGEDLVKVYLKGEFDAETKEAILSKINKLRKEACDEGITLPDTGYGDIVPALGKMTLKPEDYVEAKWSNELEQIAMIRAAECIFYYSHTRPDDLLSVDDTEHVAHGLQEDPGAEEDLGEEGAVRDGVPVIERDVVVESDAAVLVQYEASSDVLGVPVVHELRL